MYLAVTRYPFGSMEIREFDSARDREALRSCFIELQEFERTIDPRIPPGAEIAEPYLARMFERCREFDGVVLVAVVEGAVVGFVTVWTRYRSFEPEDDPGTYAYISDLVVSAPHRGRNIGHSLLQAAETRAREAGATSIRLSVLAGNTPAMSLYSAAGYRGCEIYLEKRL